MEQCTRIHDVSPQFLEACLVLAGKFHEIYGSNKVVLDPQQICYACGGADGRLQAWSKGSICRFGPGNFIVKNCDHGDLHHPRLCLNNSSSWNLMKGMLPPTGRRAVEQPHPNEFADMLEDIFSGNFGRWAMMDPPVLTETPWSMSELKVAIRRAKDKRTWDDPGLVAEFLKHALKGKRVFGKFFGGIS